MAKVNIYEAKTQLSKLVDAALNGEEVIIARRGHPLVKLVALAAIPRQRRRAGALRGLIVESDDCWEPMTEAELALWYDAPIFPPAQTSSPAQEVVCEDGDDNHGSDGNAGGGR